MIGTKSLAASAALALTLLFTACGGDGGLPSTQRALCNDTGSAWCDRALECGLQGTQSACVDAFVDGCCADDGTCGTQLDTSGVTEEDYNACLDGFADLSCQQIIDGDLPQACFML